MNPAILWGLMTHERPLGGKSVASPAFRAAATVEPLSQRVLIVTLTTSLNLLSLMFGDQKLGVGLCVFDLGVQEL